MKTTACLLAMFGISMAGLPLFAASESDGDYTVNAFGSEAGDLTVEGDTLLDGNLEVGGMLDIHGSVSLGETQETTPREAITFTYTENGTTYEVTMTATRSAASFFWKDNGGAAAANKMKLDGATNTLSLFNTSGAASLTFNPNDGRITFPPSGGGLFRSDGTARLQIDASGNLIFAAPAEFSQTIKASQGVQFGTDPAVKLNASNTDYVQDVIHQLGYREVPPPQAFSVSSRATLNGSLNFAAVAKDASGNTFVCGHYSGSITFGGETYESATTSAFVAKVDATGAVSWFQSLGGTESALSAGVAVDGSGNVYVTGYFWGTMNSGVPQSLVSAGSYDVFVAKLSTSGTVTWAKRFGGTSSDTSTGLAVDGSGNAHVTGSFSGTMNSGVPQSLVSAGSSDVFVAKLDSAGAVTWAKRFGGTNSDQSLGIAVDSSGNAHVTGYFLGTMNSGVPQSLVSAGLADVFVAKLDSAGTVTWAKRFGGTSWDVGVGLAVDSSGNAHVTGSFSGTMNSGVPQALVSAGSYDVFVAKLDSAGAMTWAKRFGGASYDASAGLAVDGSGNAHVTGYFLGTMNSGVPQALVSAGESDIFVAKLDSAGNMLWIDGYGGVYEDLISSGLAVSNGRLAFAGYAGSNFSIGDELVLFGSFLYEGNASEAPDPPVLAALSWGASEAMPGAVALGAAASANAEGAFAAGGSIGSGAYSFSAGFNNLASGDYAAAWGSHSTASGYAAAAFGASTVASGWAATAFGEGSIASNHHSTAFGAGTSAIGLGATAFGYCTLAKGYVATSMGDYTVANAYSCLALGRLNVGSFTFIDDQDDWNDGNTQWFPNDPVLEIGNGNWSDGPSNALTILKNGTLRTAEKIESKVGVRIPQQGDLSMGIFNTGQNPATLDPELGLEYPTP
jgi:hypothetical protein